MILVLRTEVARTVTTYETVYDLTSYEFSVLRDSTSKTAALELLDSKRGDMDETTEVVEFVSDTFKVHSEGKWMEMP